MFYLEVQRQAVRLGHEACDARVPIGCIPYSLRGEHTSSVAAYR